MKIQIVFQLGFLVSPWFSIAILVYPFTPQLTWLVPQSFIAIIGPPPSITTPAPGFWFAGGEATWKPGRRLASGTGAAGKNMKNMRLVYLDELNKNVCHPHQRIFVSKLEKITDHGHA